MAEHDTSPITPPAKMLLDLGDRVLGEILVDLRHDLLLHVVVEGFAQIGERARRRHHDQGLDLALAHDLLQHRRHVVGEFVLFQVVPVGLRDARSAEADRRMLPAWTVGALLVGGRVFLVDEDPLGLEVEVLRVAFVAQNQRLAAVADENIGIMRNGHFGHRSTRGFN